MCQMRLRDYFLLDLQALLQVVQNPYGTSYQSPGSQIEQRCHCQLTILVDMLH